MTHSTTYDTGTEFDRQVQNLIELGYPTMAGLGPEQFDAMVTPLRDLATSFGRTTCDSEPETCRVLASRPARLPTLRHRARGGVLRSRTHDAMDVIAQRGRPLVTIEEGIALIRASISRKTGGLIPIRSRRAWLPAVLRSPAGSCPRRCGPRSRCGPARPFPGGMSAR